MSYDDPDCFFREEQIWNQIYDNTVKRIRVEADLDDSVNTTKNIPVITIARADITTVVFELKSIIN